MQYCIICAVLFMVSFIKVSAMPQKFCGDNLTHILSQYCLSYNTSGHRVRRQIISECCRNTCSIQYLVSNYCENYNSEALEKYLKEKNEIKKEISIENENIRQDSPESYSDQADLYQQVRENYSSRYLPSDITGPITNPQWKLSSQHLHTPLNRKHRKTKSSHSKNKSTSKRNILERADLMKHIAPEPKLGQIEDSQKPFYIFKHNIS